jgi:hypothetical protein
MKTGNTLLSFFKRHFRCPSVNFGRMTSRMRRFRLYSLVLFLYDMWQIPFITLNIISTITCTDFLLTFLLCIQTVEVKAKTSHSRSHSSKVNTGAAKMTFEET